MRDSTSADLYPPGPASIPADLIKPGASYRRNAYLAVAGLCAFVGLYLALTGWLALVTYHLVERVFTGDADGVGSLIAAGFTGLLCVFMVKAIVFIKRTAKQDDLEITASDEPQLFSFLTRLADETGAPRPHRVFLSVQVNAAVFYDLSLLNLIVPSRKNLMIGLGLVNVLSLSEFKAVLAHEFGHFAQRTMAIGRWVYMAQQIAAHIVNKRDGLDQFLHSLSGADPRIAWVGWMLRIIIWSIRSLVETVFGWVVLAERALSREMERQADLVAVSATGSDALVHALHCLGPADSALDRALQFMESEGKAGRAVRDVLAVQDHALAQVRRILDDPHHGLAPPLPAEPERHRLFKARLAHPPKMWASHPPNEEREDNAKRRYLGAALDQRSAWVLFRDPAALRDRVTRSLYIEGKRPDETPPLEDSLRALDKEFVHPSFDPRYRGAYLSRSLMRHAADVPSLYDPSARSEEVRDHLAALYPPGLRDQLARRRELVEERALLKAVAEGVLETGGKVIRHRGNEYRRKHLPKVIAETERELAAAEQAVFAHDVRCRTAHALAARALGGGWEQRLRGQVAVLHYADHRERNLDDAIHTVSAVIDVVTADGRVSGRERKRMLAAAADLHGELAAVHAEASAVALGPALASRLQCASWEEKLGELELPPPTLDELGPWLAASNSWATSASLALAELRLGALAELLETEREVAEAFLQGQPLAAVEEPPRVSTRYQAFLPGAERPPQRLGWWNRFVTATGVLPATARFTVAGSVVAAFLATSWAMDRELERESQGRMSARVAIYNGLQREVLVHIGDDRVAIRPGGHAAVAVAKEGNLSVRTIARGSPDRAGQEIESFAEPVMHRQRYAYNIAAAAPLYEWTAVYNGSTEFPSRALGNPRWLRSAADDAFTPPPRSLTMNDNAMVKRLVLEPHVANDVEGAVFAIAEPAARAAMVSAHVRWDELNSKGIMLWLGADPEAARPLVAERLRRAPDSVVLRRAEQDLAADAAAVCEQRRRAATQEDAIQQYLAARCLPGAEQNEQFLALQRKWPNDPWIAMAAGMVEASRHNWQVAEPLLRGAMPRLPDLHLETALARIRRAAAADGDPDLSDLFRRSARLRALEAVHPDSPAMREQLQPFDHLGRGQLDEALRASSDGYVRALVAASEGADPALAQSVLAGAPCEGGPMCAVHVGLALRSGADVAPALERLTAQLDDTDRAGLRRFVERLRQRSRAQLEGEVTRLEGELQTLALAVQGQAYSLAVIALGERCPPAWRDLAKRLLFITERPYFR
jgi:Zn-dependent protease with chaperone function